MSSSVELRVVSYATGRVRVHWPQAYVGGAPNVRQLLGLIVGAREVRANALTRNVFVRFDERVTTADRVLGDLREVAGQSASRASRGSGRGSGGDRPPA